MSDDLPAQLRFLVPSRELQDEAADEIDKLKSQNAMWERELQKAIAEINRLNDEIDKLEKQVHQLTVHIANLESSAR